MPTGRIGSLSENKKVNIMQAALAEFGRSPYEMASFNRIIRDAKVSKGVMYYYFDSKEDLFLSLFSECLGQISQMLTVIAEEKEEGVQGYWKKNYNYLYSIYDYCSDHQDEARLIQSVIAASTREQNGPVASTIDQIDAWLLQRIIMGQELGAVRKDLPHDLLIELVWSNWRASMAWYISRFESTTVLDGDITRFALMAFDLFVRVLRPGGR